MTEKNEINSIRRAIQILNLYREGERFIGITEMATKMNLPKATVFRIVHSLEAEGWLVKGTENSKYCLGFEILLIAGCVRRQYGFKEIILAEMTKLKNRVDETVILSAYTKTTGICIEKIDPENRIKLTSEPGQALPLHAGATGKVLLAYAPEEEIQAVLQGELIPYTKETITDKELLLKQLEEIRKTGYAYTVAECNEGSLGIGAPILGKNGKLLYGLSIAGPMERMQGKGVEFLRKNLIQTAQTITEALELLQ